MKKFARHLAALQQYRDHVDDITNARYFIEWMHSAKDPKDSSTLSCFFESVEEAREAAKKRRLGESSRVWRRKNASVDNGESQVHAFMEGDEAVCYFPATV